MLPHCCCIIWERKKKHNISTFFSSKWRLSATVAWAVNSLTFWISKPKLPTNSTMFPRWEWQQNGRFFFFIYRELCFTMFVPMLFLEDKLLFCCFIVLWEIALRVCSSTSFFSFPFFHVCRKRYLNNLSGLVAQRAPVHLYKQFAHWREDVLFFIVFCFLCIIVTIIFFYN